MSNIINGVATDYEMPATNYVPYTNTTENTASSEKMEEIIMNENETATITGEESKAINDIYGGDDRDALINAANKLANRGCSVAEIAKTIHISETDVHSLLNDKYNYCEKNGRNKEYYPDPTYYQASRRMRNYKPRSTENTDLEGYDNTRIYNGEYSRSHHSRRYQLVGLIRKMAEMAGFRVVDRIVLEDIETGEVLR